MKIAQYKIKQPSIVYWLSVLLTSVLLTLPLRADPKVSDTLLDSQLDINFDGKYDEDNVSHLDAAHQHQRGGGGEEPPVDEARDEEEENHRHSEGNPTTPSVGENKLSLNFFED